MVGVFIFHCPKSLPCPVTGDETTGNDVAVITFFIPEMTHQHLAKRRCKPPRPDLFLPFFHHILSSLAQRLLVELALVEGELLTLQDVAIAAAGLAGAAGDDGVETTGLELLLEGGVDLAGGGEAGSLLSLDGLALLDLLESLALLLLATAAEGLAVVGLVPLTEGRSVDLDNGGLGQGVRADKLVVRRVVGHHNDTGLAGASLRGPGEVARVETERTVLVVTAAGADGVDALGTDTGVRRLTARLEGSLLPVVSSLGTGSGALVPRVTRDTHLDCVC
jgi:hypothetical protein